MTIIIKFNEIQEYLIHFLQSQGNLMDEFQIFKENLEKQNIVEKEQGFIEFLHLISKISNNFCRSNNFITKIVQIILFFKDDIVKNFTNYRIFNIFKENKRILLFLLEEKIIYVDKEIFNFLRNNQDKYNSYSEYFLPEIVSFCNKQQAITCSDIFEKNRKIGENPSYICELIRNDSIKEFIIYISKTNFHYKTAKIESSLFETNPYLLNKEVSLTEYAAFFGSIQILRFLQMNQVEMTPSLLLYAVHSNNPEVIHFLEEHLEIDHEKCFIESIKCHHNDFANYFISQYIYLQDHIKTCSNLITKILKYYNFAFFDNDIKYESFLIKLIKYDHYLLSRNIIENTEIDINTKYKIHYI